MINKEMKKPSDTRRLARAQSEHWTTLANRGGQLTGGQKEQCQGISAKKNGSGVAENYSHLSSQRTGLVLPPSVTINRRMATALD